MRANSLLLACFLVLFLAATGSHTVLAAEKISADDLLLEALKAEKAGGDSVKVMEKFEAVIKADPENYYALIKLWDAEDGDGNKKRAEPDRKRWMRPSISRATLARPNSPEAYLYLAQLNYRMGYITEGTIPEDVSSLNKHIVRRRASYRWRYEDTGNYYAAVLTYAAPALPGFQVYGDPYLMKKLRSSAALATSIRLGHPGPPADGR
jgi:hypothetical protein